MTQNKLRAFYFQLQQYLDKKGYTPHNAEIARDLNMTKYRLVFGIKSLIKNGYLKQSFEFVTPPPEKKDIRNQAFKVFGYIRESLNKERDAQRLTWDAFLPSLITDIDVIDKNLSEDKLAGISCSKETHKKLRDHKNLVKHKLGLSKLSWNEYFYALLNAKIKR